MFQDFYAERSPDQVANIFGTSFAQALPGLEQGKWQGPVESGLGWHLVWVESNNPRPGTGIRGSRGEGQIRMER